jgi:hypothetical protein
VWLQYRKAFARNGVDGAVLLRMLSAQAEGYSMLKSDLGIAHLGHRTVSV